MNPELTDLILEEKRDKAEEFFINLFELCNLRCSFCWQDHESKVGMDSVVNRAADVIKVIESRRKVRQAFEVNVMGGELFFDEIPDSLFDDYFTFAVRVNDYAKEVNVKVDFNWVTNLVFTKTQRVLKLMERLATVGIEGSITTSYDPRGRFNSQSFDLFRTNLDVMGSYLRSIGVVMTKPNITALMKGDARFDELSGKYKFYFDYYSPEESFATMLPKDSELLEFFKYMLDKYPHIYPFKDWINNSHNKMTCRSSNVILPTGENGKCRALVSQKLYDGFYSTIEKDNNSNMEAHFLEKRNCLTCEYFKKCGLGCFLQSNFKEHNDLDDCLFYKTYKHIDQAG